jgi:hypothetical protein
MRNARLARVLFFAFATGILAVPARAQWVPPIGIPAPSFGITQTAPPAPNPWTSAVPGFYYVEQKAGATNANNPYGTPAKPRITIPNPIPAGSVVEIHGFYDAAQTSPNTILAQGTAANPVFIRGVSSSARPIIRRAWEVAGTYLVLENLEFGPTPDQTTTGSVVVLAPTSHIALRHSDLHGTLDDGGLGIENWNGGASRVDNVVIWHNSFHDNGDVNATFDQDVEGIHVGSHASYVWVVDNEMARNSGDGIQINATEQFKSTTHHIYVGRNISHHNKQGGFWVKQAVDVIFSQNIAFAHRPGNSSLGHCLGAQYAPDYVWWIYNRAYDCEYGIALFSDWQDGQTSHDFFIGNVINNIHNTQAGLDANDDWSPAGITVSGGYERHFVNNTFYDVDSGINVASPFGSVEVKNNVIVNLSQSAGNHVNIGFGSVVGVSTMDHNLFFPTPRINLDGTKYFLSTAQMAQMKSVAKDPLFRNPAALDFHIGSNSPAAASGEASNVYSTFQQRYGISILSDADGNPRPQASWMDIGAYSTGGWGILYIDTPASASVVGNSLVVSGWAIDKSAPTGTGIDAIHVYATPSGGSPQFIGVGTYGANRPDIGNIYGSRFAPSGFSLNVTLVPGSYSLTVFGHSTATGGFTVAMAIPITVTGPASQPMMTLDAPLSNGTSGSAVTVSGWAIDRGAPAGTGVDQVHVWAYPSGGGSPIGFVATYGRSRPDVGTFIGDGRFTNSGFQVVAPLPPGLYTITAYMHSTMTGTFNLTMSATNVTVNATTSNPQINIDTSPGSKARPFTISGWSADTGAPTGTGIDAIHVWAFPISGAPQFFVGVGTYGTARPDVGSYLGNSRFNNSGYTLTVTNGTVPAAGTYDFYVFAHSTVTGTFSVARIVRVTVQ